MTAELMNDAHRAAGCGAAFDWCLSAGAAEALGPTSTGCFVRVEEGALWLTRTLDRTALARREQPDDLWLGAGESLWLPAGSRWVLQAWPAARVRLLQAPPARRAAAHLAPLGSAVRRRLRSWGRRLSGAASGAWPLPSALR